MFDDPPPRRRADQPWGDAEDRRFHDWSDLEATHDAPEPPQPVQDAPRPALRVLPVLQSDPEPSGASEATPARAPDPVAGVRAWASRRLADIEAELRYRRLVDKRKGDTDGPS